MEMRPAGVRWMEGWEPADGTESDPTDRSVEPRRGTNPSPGALHPIPLPPHHRNTPPVFPSPRTRRRAPITDGVSLPRGSDLVAGIATTQAAGAPRFGLDSRVAGAVTVCSTPPVGCHCARRQHGRPAAVPFEARTGFQKSCTENNGHNGIGRDLGRADARSDPLRCDGAMFASRRGRPQRVRGHFRPSRLWPATKPQADGADRHALPVTWAPPAMFPRRPE